VTSFGTYDESYPPEILRGYTAPEPPVMGAARRAATTPTTESTLTVVEGAPGEYEPALEPTERPRTLDELAAQTRLTSPAPWRAGSFVLYANGKRAHWSGDEWRSHESPGYPTSDAGQESSTPVADANAQVEAEASPRSAGDASRSADDDGSADDESEGEA